MMNNKKKLSVGVLMLLLAMMIVVSACGSNNSSSSSSPVSSSSQPSTSNSEVASADAATGGIDTSEHVDLTWYYPQWSDQKDLAKVEEAMNKIVNAKINATIHLKPINMSDYEQKMNTSIAANEAFDIVWTSNWAFQYRQNATKGAFLPLDELLAQLAPETKASMPDFIWDATRVKTKIYGVPNYQTITNRAGYVVQKQYADKYNLDPASVKSFADMEPFLKAVKAGEPNLIPLGMDRTGAFLRAASAYNLEVITQTGAYEMNDESTKIVNVYETQQFKDYLQVVRSWYEKGYINEDSPTLKTVSDILSTGTVVASFNNVLKPGGEAEYKKQFGNNDVIYVPISQSVVSTNSIITTMNAISRTSKNPERAMMFLNLMNTDKELYNLMSFGIQDVHYKKIDDQTISAIADSGYSPGTNWMFGNTFNSYYQEGQQPGVWEETIKDNSTAIPSKLMGFAFDEEPVKSELANITTVKDEMEGMLSTGSVDYERYLPKLLERLKSAGADKVNAELQKQIDEWKAANGK